MRHPVRAFYEFLDRPLLGPSRVVLAALSLGLVLAFAGPIWQIHLIAPQYPDGLWMDIWAYKLEGGGDGQHVQEINTLNHYIGMRPIDREALSDLDWIPFALAGLVLLGLRVAAIGTVRSLVDLAVLSLFFTLVSFGRFTRMLWLFGHDLSPTAPMRVEPFMPPLVGSKQIANFVSSSLPRWGSLFLGLFVAGVLGLAAWHLVIGRRRAAAREAEVRAS
jgi:copper chaperone NosL